MEIVIYYYFQIIWLIKLWYSRRSGKYIIFYDMVWKILKAPWWSFDKLATYWHKLLSCCFAVLIPRKFIFAGDNLEKCMWNVYRGACFMVLIIHQIMFWKKYPKFLRQNISIWCMTECNSKLLLSSYFRPLTSFFQAMPIKIHFEKVNGTLLDKWVTGL